MKHNFNELNSTFKCNFCVKWLIVLDPLQEKFMGLSDYNYCLNNPINAIDPDGEDVIVLNNPNGASGFGHLAVFVGLLEAAGIPVTVK